MAIFSYDRETNTLINGRIKRKFELSGFNYLNHHISFNYIKFKDKIEEGLIYSDEEHIIYKIGYKKIITSPFAVSVNPKYIKDKEIVDNLTKPYHIWIPECYIVCKNKNSYFHFYLATEQIPGKISTIDVPILNLHTGMISLEFPGLELNAKHICMGTILANANIQLKSSNDFIEHANEIANLILSAPGNVDIRPTSIKLFTELFENTLSNDYVPGIHILYRTLHNDHKNLDKNGAIKFYEELNEKEYIKKIKSLIGKE